jgi:hypothetical protein
MITGKIAQDCWFDNWMAKPPMIDQFTPYSVLVFFEVRSPESQETAKFLSGYYAGQFNYQSESWDIIPTQVPQVSVPDQYVHKWMHIPDGAAYDKGA